MKKDLKGTGVNRAFHFSNGGESVPFKHYWHFKSEQLELFYFKNLIKNIINIKNIMNIKILQTLKILCTLKNY